jgi:hypothetical protein
MQNWSDIPAPTPAPSQPQGTANMQAAAKKSNEMAQAGSDLLRRTTFLGQIPVGPEQTTLSILSKADVGRLGPVNQAMMGVLHADDLSTEAFLDQLERSQEQGIPMSFAEHQKCTKLIEDKYNKRYILHGRNASRSMLPIEKRLAAMIRHLDCTDGKFGDYEIHTIVERYPNLNSLNVSSKKSNNITDKALALIAKLS